MKNILLVIVSVVAILFLAIALGLKMEKEDLSNQVRILEAQAEAKEKTVTLSPKCESALYEQAQENIKKCDSRMEAYRYNFLQPEIDKAFQAGVVAGVCAEELDPEGCVNNLK